VVKTGISLDHCPFIDLAGLDPEQITPATPKNQEAADLEFIASLKEKIRPFDLADLAPQLGATSNTEHPDTLFFRYLGQNVTLSKTLLLIDGHEPEDPRDQILLYNYVFSQGNRPPTNDWIGMESLPNSISKIKTLNTYCEIRLAELFAALSVEQVWSAFQSLGGTAAANHNATLGAVIPVLPMIPQSVLFWEAAPEDNFTAQVKVLFDRHVLSYLDLESLIFSAERLADRLALLLNP